LEMSSAMDTLALADLDQEIMLPSSYSNAGMRDLLPFATRGAYRTFTKRFQI